ncbi:MAG: hypothetical protein ABW186_02110 [Rhodanobacteraceae bacterium]
MRETKPDDLSRNDAAPLEGPRNERRHSTRSNAALKPAAVARAPASSLPALKALISSHKTLLATVRRSNELLAIDNTRMERALGVRADTAPADGAPREDAAIAARDERAKLVWVRNYIHGTLAQTLWALNARAEQLDEQATSSAQQQQAHRLLEMTHIAYDQLRDLMSWLQRNTDE